MSVVSVLLPAIRASHIPPVAAMRPEVGFGALSLSQRLIRGFVLAGVGLVMFLFGLFVRPGSGGQWGLLTGAGALLILFGVTTLSAAIARPMSQLIGAPIAKMLGISGRFARDNAAGSPRRTARTASALMIGVTLITGAAVFTSSLRDTFGRILEEGTSFDYIVLDSESFQPLTPEIANRLEQLPELSAVSPFRNIRANVGDATATFTAVEPVAFPELANLDVTAGGFSDVTAADGVMAYRGAAQEQGVDVGDSLEVTWQNGNQSTLTVAGLFDDNSLGANWFVSVDLLESVSTQTPTDQFVVAKRAEGVDAATARQAIDTAIVEFPQATVQSNNEFVEEQKGQIDTLLFLVTMLLTVAIAFSFLGIAITLALSVFERTREIGLLRAVGMGRRKLRRAVRGEAVIVTLFGALIGVVLGLLFGLVALVRGAEQRDQRDHDPVRHADLRARVRRDRSHDRSRLSGLQGIPHERAGGDRHRVMGSGVRLLPGCRCGLRTVSGGVTLGQWHSTPTTSARRRSRSFESATWPRSPRCVRTVRRTSCPSDSDTTPTSGSFGSSRSTAARRLPTPAEQAAPRCRRSTAGDG